jgi:hypothetical protein
MISAPPATAMTKPALAAQFVPSYILTKRKSQSGAIANRLEAIPVP